MKNKVIIIGAGVTGLSAGWKLSEAGYDVKIIEKLDHIGGMSATFKHKDYMLDLGPHKIFTVLDRINKEIDHLYKDEKLLTVKKTSKVWIGGKYIDYPFGLKGILFGLGLYRTFQYGFGYIFTIIKKMFVKDNIVSYKDWVISNFGRPVFDLVLGPYANKIWAPPETLSRELAQGRIAAPSLIEIIKQMIFGMKSNAPVINADYFKYPQKGAGDICDKMNDLVLKNGGKILLKKTLSKINIDPDNENITSIESAMPV